MGGARANHSLCQMNCSNGVKVNSSEYQPQSVECDHLPQNTPSGYTNHLQHLHIPSQQQEPPVSSHRELSQLQPETLAGGVQPQQLDLGGSGVNDVSPASSSATSSDLLMDNLQRLFDSQKVQQRSESSATQRSPAATAETNHDLRRQRQNDLSEESDSEEPMDAEMPSTSLL